LSGRSPQAKKKKKFFFDIKEQQERKSSLNMSGEEMVAATSIV